MVKGRQQFAVRRASLNTRVKVIGGDRRLEDVRGCNLYLPVTNVCFLLRGATCLDQSAYRVNEVYNDRRFTLLCNYFEFQKQILVESSG